MAVEEWPIAEGTRSRRDACVLSLPPLEGRVSAAAALLAGAAAQPLPDADRARVPVIVEGLIADIQIDLRARVLERLDAGRHPELHADLAGASDPAAARRVPGRTVVPSGVLEAALARAEMFRLAGPSRPGPAGIDGPLADDRRALSAAVARRVDGFGEPLLELDDLPAEAAHALVWTVAALLRATLGAGGVPDLQADALAVEAGRARLEGHDEAAGLYGAAERLASNLSAAGDLDDALLTRLCDGGELLALTACLGRRVDLPARSLWPLLAQPGEGGLALLLRAARTPRETAARILLRFLHVDDDPLAELLTYDRCGLDEARDALAVLGYHPAYRDALRGLSIRS